MITVPEVVRTIVKNSPYLADGISRDIINLSGLARDIRSEVEKKTMKDVQIGSIIMALKRLQKDIQKTDSLAVFHSYPEIIVRSNLFEITVLNNEETIQNQQRLLQYASNHPEFFSTITSGVFETTIIAGTEARETISLLYDKKHIIADLDELSSITIKFSKDIIDVAGVYSMILKTLAWEGIPFTEIVSTYSELTIIVKNAYVTQAFSLIKDVFSP